MTPHDKNFVINSIKMDLYRIVTAAGNIKNDLPRISIKAFLSHAIKDFNKIKLTKLQSDLKKELIYLQEKVDGLNNPFDRLRWAEKILTIRCRL